MVEELKNIRDAVLRSMLAGLAGLSQNEDDDGDFSTDQGRRGLRDFATLRDIISAVAGWAGKSKDEVIQTLSREIGLAIAAMLKEPLTQAVKGHKLTVTFELNQKPHKPEHADNQTNSGREKSHTPNKSNSHHSHHSSTRKSPKNKG